LPLVAAGGVGIAAVVLDSKIDGGVFGVLVKGDAERGELQRVGILGAGRGHGGEDTSRHCNEGLHLDSGFLIAYLAVWWSGMDLSDCEIEMG
jgi:hypothetical protein